MRKRLVFRLASAINIAMKALDLVTFIERAKNIHGGLYDYSRVEYRGRKTKVAIICDAHGEFGQTPNNHLHGKGCKDCGHSKSAEKRLCHMEEFLARAHAAHGNKYDYSEVEYKGAHTHVTIICPAHGAIRQTPQQHWSHGCKYCSHKSQTQEQFIERAISRHNNKYDYSNVVYVNARTDVEILCKYHNRSFFQTPDRHVGQGAGCPYCSGHKGHTTETFISRSLKTHGNKYDYTKVIYKTAIKKVTITCPKDGHGDFVVTPNHHLTGHGCPKCSRNISKPETNFLDLIGVPETNRQKRIGSFVVDGYDLNTSTIYEFDGDFFHGNPDIYEQKPCLVANRFRSAKQSFSLRGKTMFIGSGTARGRKIKTGS